jgi:hypothetical protein
LNPKNEKQRTKKKSLEILFIKKRKNEETISIYNLQHIIHVFLKREREKKIDLFLPLYQLEFTSQG